MSRADLREHPDSRLFLVEGGALLTLRSGFVQLAKDVIRIVRLDLIQGEIVVGAFRPLLIRELEALGAFPIRRGEDLIQVKVLVPAVEFRFLSFGRVAEG